LASTRSILNHLLEEYNIKYGLNIQLTDYLNVKTFKREATNQNNRAAINFITNFTKELDNLNKDKLWHFMQYTRNTKIHRSNPSIKKHFHAIMTENLTLQDNIVAIVYDKNGNIKKPRANLVEQKFIRGKE